MTRELVTQMFDCLLKLSEQSDCDVDPFTFTRYGGHSAILAAREYLAKEPKELTNDEIDEIGVDFSGNYQVLRDFARTIEAFIKSKDSL